ncbi:MAG: DUF1854 domain-containing protein [Eubacteriales bacterium]|nr:DUF1854 domain-containing protein [Clostridiales bacterium]
MADTRKSEANTESATALRDVVKIVRLDEEAAAGNAVFYKNSDFLALRAKIENENGEREEKTWDRVFLHRAFPFDDPYRYISVLDKDQNEIGIIGDLRNIEPEIRKLLEEELERKYYTPEIKAIKQVKERYGFSYWKVETDIGPLQFTVQDTYRSILRVTPTRIFIVDMNGNRYEVPDLEALDRKSYRLIELYL